MKTVMRSGFVMAALVLLLLAGCATRGRYVAEHPYEPYYDRPVAPYRGAVWIPGEYIWQGNKYVYTKGYYTKPRRNHAYVRGYWHQSPNGYTWHKGYWR